MDFESAGILVADDYKVVRRKVVATVHGLGCEVEETENGQKIFEVMEEGQVPDLLSTDGNMPRANGP